MASGLYEGARQQFLKAGINWESADIRALLVSPSYTFSAAHNFISDLGGTELTGVTDYARQSVTGRSVGTGTPTYLLASDIRWVGLGGVSNGTIGMVILFVHTGSDATARLICALDNPDLPTQDQDVVAIFENGRVADWG